jgi:lipid II:glycine glycyltransferase (peptidoglycan interpeptide bridge formation enzyme)
VLDFLYAWARDKGVLSIKFEPYISFDAVGALATHLHVVRSSMPLFTEWNLEVSLAGDAAALLSRYAKNTRNSIRAAERAGVAVSASTEDTDFEIFLDLYFKTCARQNYHGHTRAYHRTLWHTLRDAGIARVYIARYNNAPHTACMVFTWHDTAFYPYAGNSGEHRSVAAGQLLVARVLEDAQRAGLRAVDLWGALPPDHNSNHPWSGFTYFKKGFGAEYVHLSPSFDLIAQPLGYMLYRLAYRLRALWFKL